MLVAVKEVPPSDPSEFETAASPKPSSADPLDSYIHSALALSHSQTSGGAGSEDKLGSGLQVAVTVTLMVVLELVE